jgi:hypothetical protein
MSQTILLKRGLKSNLPAEAAQGEPILTLDTAELFVGRGAGQSLLKVSDLHYGTVAPSDITKLWVDTNLDLLKRYDGAVWVIVGANPSVQFSALQGSPTDNTALASALSAKADASALAAKADITYVDAQIALLVTGMEWQPSVLSILSTPPGSPVIGDRYLVGPGGTGAFLGQDSNIAQYTAGGWVFTVPTTGMIVAVDDTPDALYLYGGAAWSAKAFETTTASGGLEKVGVDIRVAAAFAGSGLALAAGVLSVDTIDGGTF